MRLVWSIPARRDLFSIADYFDAVAPGSGDRMLDRIATAPLVLLDHPRLRSTLEDGGGLRKWTVRQTPFSLLYVATDAQIDVRRVFHARPDRMIRTGLLGGSFNPAHRGHRRISLAAIDALALDEIWWLVSPGNPLKPDTGMAPLAARLASARAMARRAPIRATAIEARLDTRYTVDTIAALIRRHPRRRFIWLMGADNLQQFDRWRDWRRIARSVAIAVVARPGYDPGVRRAKAMGWLRRFVRPAARAHAWTQWRTPAIVMLRFRPDATSATRLRGRDPAWHARIAHARIQPQAPRDPATRRPVP